MPRSSPCNTCWSHRSDPPDPRRDPSSTYRARPVRSPEGHPVAVPDLCFSHPAASTDVRSPMTPPPTASTSTLDDTAARSATRLAHPRSAVHHLRAAGVSVVIDCQGPRLPRIAHWGADLGDLDDGLLADLVLADVQAVVSNVPDEPIRPSILTEHAAGWSGLPGLLGHRGGRSWSTLFTASEVRVDTDSDGTQRLVSSARDDDAGLGPVHHAGALPAGGAAHQGAAHRSVHRSGGHRDALHPRRSHAVAAGAEAGVRIARLRRAAPARAGAAAPAVRHRRQGAGQPAWPDRRGRHDTAGRRHRRLRLRFG